jgi:predicted ATPase/class 3 adenylate cyclase
MPDLPTGTVTFLFTDIEGSTSVLQRLGDDFRAVVDQHGRILREAIASGGGTEVNTEGDSFFAVFPTPKGALSSAVQAQLALAAHPWPRNEAVRVRMGMHTGEGVLGGDNYIGLDVHLAARIAAAGHGGQVLLSEPTRVLIGDALPDRVSLRDLGQHHLKDIEHIQRLHQLVIEGLAADFPPIRTREARLASLPDERTSFIGREREVEEVGTLLEQSRLVTLAGPGGTGKTRLALRLAAERIEAYPDGAFFVDLASLTDATLVPHAIAQTVGVREEAGVPVMSTVAQRLSGKRMLVILDNCEHLLDACAQAVDLLLRETLTPTVVATSREVLGIPGEIVFRVPSLALPSADSMTHVVRSESARLFLERAAAVTPGFEVTGDNAAAIADICRRLDGIPLAIELAAARTPVLSAQEIARRLDDRFRLLTTGSRTALPRQQTLRALIAWSYDLLGPEERLLFRRLAVFAGGMTLGACEAVCGGETSAGHLAEADILDSLTGLVAKSLISAERSATTRYHMLDTTRAYAREELSASGEEAAVRDRHLGWCFDLSRRAEPELVGAHQREWFDLLSADHDNLRAALAWGLEHHPRQMLEMAKSLYWFWQARGHATEGRAWLDAGLNRPEASSADDLRQNALLGAGSLAWVLGDDAAARRQLGESADIAAQMGDRRARAIALAILGHAMVDADDLVAARTILEESVGIAREVRDPFVLARSLGTLADLARHEGKDEEATLTADEAISVFERVGMDEGVAFNLFYGGAGLRQRDPEEAVVRLIRAIELFDKLDLPHGLYLALLLLTDITRPPAESAARLLGALEVLHERTGFRISTVDRQMSERIRAAAVDVLGPDRFATLAAEGRSLPRSSILPLARPPSVGAGGFEPPTSAL